MQTAFPQCNTLNAGIGGSSVLGWNGGRFKVGPESVGAVPLLAAQALQEHVVAPDKLGMDAALDDYGILANLLHGVVMIPQAFVYPNERARLWADVPAALAVGVMPWHRHPRRVLSPNRAWRCLQIPKAWR